MIFFFLNKFLGNICYKSQMIVDSSNISFCKTLTSVVDVILVVTIVQKDPTTIIRKTVVKMINF